MFKVGSKVIPKDEQSRGFMLRDFIPVTDVKYYVVRAQPKLGLVNVSPVWASKEAYSPVYVSKASYLKLIERQKTTMEPSEL